MVTEVRLRQVQKAYSPMEVTLAGIVEFLHPAISVLLSVSITALELSLESYTVFQSSTITEDTSPLP